MSYTYAFPMVSATATMLIIQRAPIIQHSTVLLAKRSPNVEVYPNMLSLPGGFLNANQETIEEAAVRELKEEIDFDCSIDRLNLFHVSSKPGTDPRAHVINVCFWIEVAGEEAQNFKPADDVSGITWVGVGGLMSGNATPLAFNHNKLTNLGLRNWFQTQQSNNTI